LALEALAVARILNPIREAETGREAQEYLEGTGRFSNRTQYPVASILLVDVHLSMISGLEVLRWIRERKPPGLLRVLAWTGASSPGEKLAMRECGVACVDKPVDLAGYERLFKNFHGLRLESSGDGRVFRMAPIPNPLGIIEIAAFAK